MEDGPEVALVEPARAQVVLVAADVLGRLPADQMPAPLRPIARFAPAKRQRLGAVALAAALDGDNDFRARVAEAVEEGAPQLVAAVRDGASTAAADPVDVAVVAYLTRPEGWQQVLAAANARWHAERGAGVDRQDELDRVRAELADARARLKGEPGRLREAVDGAVAASVDELAKLRRTVRERTRELRAAERDRDAALAAATEVRAQLAAQAAAHENELRRLRARQADVERAAEAARRDARIDRDVDDARLWLLVDTLVQAATGVRRELSLAPPTLRPADAVHGDGGTGRGSSVADPAALDRVLALPNVHVIVDGYNVTKGGYAELSLAGQRTRLVTALAGLVGQSGAEVTVAFDGGAKPPMQQVAPRGVRVLFSAADEIADDLIRRLVAAEPAGRPLAVVTSDQQIVADVRRAGAWTVPSTVLLARLDAAR